MGEEEQENKKQFAWLRKLGLAGFLFFLIKGILWLVLFFAIYFGFMNEEAVEKVKELLPF